MKRSPLAVSAAIAVPIAIVITLFSGWLAPVEDQFTRLKYRVRGSEQADTNIVIIYIDNDAVKTLGWPVRRNFQALMFHALASLHPRAIGAEVVFEDPKMSYQDFPEYDTLLASTVRDAGNVVLACYFQETGRRSDTSSIQLSPSIDYPRVHGDLPRGSGLHLPLPSLSAAAAGVGHVNFLDDQSNIPPVVMAGSHAVPAFSMDVLRVASGTSRSDVLLRDGLVLLDRDGKERRIPLAADGTVRLNFPGTLRSFTHYSFLDVLRSYDALRHGSGAPVPLEQLTNKIILVGIIAEGRSEFRPTPLDPRTPSIVLQAAFLDNALRSGFLTAAHPALVTVLLLFVFFGCAAGVLLLPRPWNIVVPLSGIALLLVIALLLFVTANVMFPLSGILMGGIIAVVAAMLIRWRAEERRVDAIAAERDAIVTQLKEKEANVALLERRLRDRSNDENRARTDELLEQIRCYKEEIRALSARAQDMEQSEPAPGDAEAEAETFEGIVHNASGAMKGVIDFIRKIAPSDAPVLILGESGTGKELVARAIHTRSPRKDGPFIAVNCGALAESLLESELFGHEKGAFTGAVKDRMGRFELADGGTIFLDEIGEVSEAFQLKLLRVLQQGEFERVGGTKTIRVNVRVVAATNKDLGEEVTRGHFRQDLYYRLNVLAVSLPPLRERPGDVSVLTRYFLDREDPAMSVSKGVMEILRSHSWPGNVRELESTIRRAVLMARAEDRSMIAARDLPQELAATLRGVVPVHEQVLDMVRSRGFSRSSVSDTAAELGGLNRGTVAEYLRGECLRIFAEQGYVFDEAVRHIALTADETVLDRVRKRLNEYLANVASGVDLSQPWEHSLGALKPKVKNLPQRYHPYVEQIGEAYHRGTWRI